MTHADALKVIDLLSGIRNLLLLLIVVTMAVVILVGVIAGAVTARR